MTIKAIETRYAGYRFRSRVEARWGVFFTHLGLRWEYEPEGFIVDGQPYLPDFRLIPPGPSGEIYYAEVKGGDADDFEGDHIVKCRALADEAETSVLLLTGPPALRMYNVFAPGSAPNGLRAAFFQDFGRRIHIADAYWFQFVELNRSTGQLEFTHDDRQARKSFGSGLVEAIEAARSARFEHGETP